MSATSPVFTCDGGATTRVRPVSARRLPARPPPSADRVLYRTEHVKMCCSRAGTCGAAAQMLRMMRKMMMMMMKTSSQRSRFTLVINRRPSRDTTPPPHPPPFIIFQTCPQKSGEPRQTAAILRQYLQNPHRWGEKKRANEQRESGGLEGENTGARLRGEPAGRTRRPVNSPLKDALSYRCSDQRLRIIPINRCGSKLIRCASAWLSAASS